MKWVRDRDHLQVATPWAKIEANMPNLVNVLFEGRFLVSTVVVRGCRVIKCLNQFLEDFVGEIVTKNGDESEGTKLSLNSTKNIPYLATQIESRGKKGC